MKAKILLLGVAILAFAGCTGSATDIAPESVFPADIGMVMSVDFSDKGQAKNFEELLDRFPENESVDYVFEQMKKSIDNDFDEGFYGERIAPIFDSEWEILIGMSFTEEQIVDMDNVDLEDAEIYFVGKFKKADKMEELFEYLNQKAEEEETDGLIREEDGDFVLWYSDEEDTPYIVRYGDVFFMTMSEKFKDEAVDRIQNGGGLEDRENSQLAYAHMSSEMFKTFSQDPGFDAVYGDFFEDFGYIDYGVSAEDEGFYLEMEMELGGMMGDYYDSFDFENIPDFKSKVPGDGLILYSDSPYTMSLPEWDFETFDSGEESEDFEGVLMEMMYNWPYYAIDGVSDVTDLSREDLVELLKAPAAISVSDVGELYPSISFYMEVEGDNAENFTKLIAGLDDFVDEVIVMFDAEVEGEPYVGAIKKEIVTRESGNLHKVYWDWDSIADTSEFDELADEVGINFKDVNLEIYYGMIEEDRFVLAIYPDFVDAYGQNVVADNEDYKESIANLKGDEYFAYGYFSFENLFVLIDQYVEIAQENGEMSGREFAQYNEVVDFVKTVNNMSMGCKKDGDVISVDGFVRIEELEKEEEEKDEDEE